MGKQVQLRREPAATPLGFRDTGLRERRADRLLGLPVALAVLAALTACDVGMANTRLDFSATEKVAVTEIRIAGGGGDVNVTGGGPAGEVRIDRVVRYRGDEPGATYRIAGTVLHIATDCGRNCGVSYDIAAPPGVSVRGQNGSGGITLADVAAVDVELGSGSISVTNGGGDVAVRTGSGDINVSAVAGALNAQTGSGSIEARGVAGGNTRVHTGSGDLTVALGKPGNVDAKAGTGNVEVLVPTGQYQVEATTGSGDLDIRVPDDPAATQALRLDTGSGDITVAAG